MENKTKVEQAYLEILSLLRKYNDICNFDVDSFETKSKHHLFGLELKEKYGLNIDPTRINSFGRIDASLPPNCWGPSIATQ